MVMHGPFGGRGSINWSTNFDKDKRITKVMIRNGDIVDGIGFEIADSKGSTSVEWFSEEGGQISEITLDSDEYITQISGTHGSWYWKILITSLSIHTNKCPRGYGPFGGAIGVSNNTPFITTRLKDHAIINFSGYRQEYLHSIAAHSRPKMVGVPGASGRGCGLSGGGTSGGSPSGSFRGGSFGGGDSFGGSYGDYGDGGSYDDDGDDGSYDDNY